MPSSLQKAEYRLQTLLEKGLGRFSRSGMASHLAQQIIFKMRDLTREGKGSLRLAPDQFVVAACSRTWKKIRTDQDWVNKVTEALIKEANESGLVFQSPLRIDPAVDDSLPVEEFHIECHWQSDAGGKTQTIVNQLEGQGTATQPGNRDVLIFDNGRIFQLDHPVVNLGRRRTNDLVLDDSRISRQHAQLRFADGRFSIYDLGSTGGTFVNGQQISSRVLNPGDVISLAGFLVIYNREDEVTETNQLKIQPLGESEAVD